MSWPWSQLGLPGPANLSQIRRAYAEKLKTAHPEEDPEGFQRLHAAYQQACRMTRQRAREEQAKTEPSLEREKQKHPPRREGGTKDFNFNQLLQAGEAASQYPPRQEDGTKDFDFDQLLQEGEAVSQYPPWREEETEELDFEQLLREEEEVPRRTQEKKRDFDFERLFAEGEAERAEARRRRGEERRRAQERERWERSRQERDRRNTYERERRERFDQEQLKWQNTETILHTIERMIDSQADWTVWERFFQSPLFQQTKGSLDLIFGLEDIVSTRSLSREIQMALFAAYGFDKGPSRPELRFLYQMLLPTWKAVHGSRKRQLKGMAVCLLSFIVLTLLCYEKEIGMTVPLLFLAFGIGVWVIQEAVQLGLQKKQVRGRPVTKRWKAAICFILALFLIGSLPGPWKLLDWTKPDPREQVCQRMEQDFGVTFQSIYIRSKMERYSNVFAPADNVGRMFLAGPSGEPGEADSTGYTTNYPDMMVLWSLEEFAEDWGLRELDLINRNQNLESWETSGTYLVVLPFYGAGEIITALGALLEELSQENWYQLRPPVFKLVLCGRQTEEGRLILWEYQSDEEPFDAREIRELYESAFAHSYCAQMIQECGLDRDFIEGAEERYTLTNEGMAQWKGAACCKLFGLDSRGETAMEYYVNVTGGLLRSVYCVPGGFWEMGGEEEQLEFYRLIHRENNLEILCLYYPRTLLP